MRSRTESWRSASTVVELSEANTHEDDGVVHVLHGRVDLRIIL